MSVSVRGEIVQSGCVGHLPDFRIFKKMEAEKGLFGIKRSWTKFCCWVPMAKYKKIEISRCEKCGKEGGKKEEDVLVCSLCGCRLVKFIIC